MLWCSDAFLSLKAEASLKRQALALTDEPTRAFLSLKAEASLKLPENGPPISVYRLSSA